MGKSILIALRTNLSNGDNSGHYGDGFQTSVLGFDEVSFLFKYRLDEVS